MKPKKGATSSPLNTAAVDMVSSRLSERERERARRPKSQWQIGTGLRRVTRRIWGSQQARRAASNTQRRCGRRTRSRSGDGAARPRGQNGARADRAPRDHATSVMWMNDGSWGWMFYRWSCIWDVRADGTAPIPSVTSNSLVTDWLGPSRSIRFLIQPSHEQTWAHVCFRHTFLIFRFTLVEFFVAIFLFSFFFMFSWILLVYLIFNNFF